MSVAGCKTPLYKFSNCLPQDTFPVYLWLSHDKGYTWAQKKHQTKLALSFYFQRILSETYLQSWGFLGNKTDAKDWQGDKD